MSVTYPDSDAHGVPNNAFGVPARQWRKWSTRSKAVFNVVFVDMEDQSLISHPLAAPQSDKHWETIRWNAAWLAADAAQEVYESERPVAGR